MNQETKGAIDLYRTVDTIHGIITLSKLAGAIARHRIFQRLKELMQLGMCYAVFGGKGDHSRYDHSVGVAHLSRMAATALQKKHPEITDREVLCVEIAGLCHDLGHGPFSHTFDDLLHEEYKNSGGPNIKHESRSIVLFDAIIADLRKDGLCDLTDPEVALVRLFIHPGKKDVEYVFKGRKYLHAVNNTGLQFFAGLEQIVSNGLSRLADTDRLDYLMRDAHYLGIAGSLRAWDLETLFGNSDIIRGYWAFADADYAIISEIINRRTIFYSNFYLHPDSLAAGSMISDAMRKVRKHIDIGCHALATPADIDKFCGLTDRSIIDAILNGAGPDFAEAAALVRRIFRGDLYKSVAKVITKSAKAGFAETSQDKTNAFQDKNSPVNVLGNVYIISAGRRLVKLSSIKITVEIYNKK